MNVLKIIGRLQVVKDVSFATVILLDPQKTNVTLMMVNVFVRKDSGADNVTSVKVTIGGIQMLSVIHANATFTDLLKLSVIEQLVGLYFLLVQLLLLFML